MGLWHDIKERRITQVVLAYLAGGWIVLSVVDQFTDRGVIPDVFYRVALVAFLFGIPAALVLGWYHGEKGTQRAPPSELGLLGLILVACLATSGFVVRNWLEEGERGELLTLESSLDLRRVAVLYFRAGSDDLEPIASGLTESLIERLSEVGELDVISARGTARFRGSDLSPDSIASLLGAGTVIEGSLSRSRGELRVNVALLDGESGTELERIAPRFPEDDLVGISERLPVEVARQFRAVLGREIDLRTARRSTDSDAAWLLVQRARALVHDAEEATTGDRAQEALEAYRSADEQLRRALELDPEWSEPHVLRGWIAFERHAFAESLEELRESLEAAEALANEALALDTTSPSALELRGTARYRLWLARLAPSDQEAEELFRAARADLDQAILLDNGLARAHNVLSHLNAMTGDLTQAVLEARKAYQEDAYLRSADQVLDRLFSLSYDLEEHDQARRWCVEGSRRFPRDHRFVECQILTMTMPAASPDVPAAWSLLARLEPLAPELRRIQVVSMAKVAVGAVIARAGLPDSADIVMAEARREGDPVDPDGEIMVFEAAMRSVLGQTERAIELLQRYTLSHPGHFDEGSRLHWWYSPLRGDPRFQAIRRLN